MCGGYSPPICNEYPAHSRCSFSNAFTFSLNDNLIIGIMNLSGTVRCGAFLVFHTHIVQILNYMQSNRNLFCKLIEDTHKHTHSLTHALSDHQSNEKTRSN